MCVCVCEVHLQFLTFCCTRIISLEPATPRGSVFVMTMADCSMMFMKLRRENLHYKIGEYNNNWKKYISI